MQWICSAKHKRIKLGVPHRFGKIWLFIRDHVMHVYMITCLKGDVLILSPRVPPNAITFTHFHSDLVYSCIEQCICKTYNKPKTGCKLYMAARKKYKAAHSPSAASDITQNHFQMQMPNTSPTHPPPSLNQHTFPPEMKLLRCLETLWESLYWSLHI